MTEPPENTPDAGTETDAETGTDTGTDSAAATDRPARRPSPTSRARRIGGAAGPRPARRPATPTETAGTAASATPAPPPAQTEPGEPGAKPAARPVPPAPVGEAESRGSRSAAARWAPASALGVVVLVLLVIEAVVSHGVYWAKPSTSAGQQAVRQEQVLAAAKKCFAQINTYDYRHLDGLVTKDVACTTGQFTTDVRRALQTQILKLAPKLHAVQTAQVNKAGISSVNQAGDQVVVLIYGQLAQSNNSTAKSSPRVDVIGAVVTVDKVGGQWLISKVDADSGSLTGS